MLLYDFVVLPASAGRRMGHDVPNPKGFSFASFTILPSRACATQKNQNEVGTLDTDSGPVALEPGKNIVKNHDSPPASSVRFRRVKAQPVPPESVKTVATPPQAPGRPVKGASAILPPIHVPAADNPGATTVQPDVVVDVLSQPDAELVLCSWLLRMKAEDIEAAQQFLDRVPDKYLTYPCYRNIVTCARHLIARNEVSGAAAVLEYAERQNLDVGGVETLAQILVEPLGVIADVARVDQNIDIIVDYARRREIRQVCLDRLDDLATRSCDDLIMALADDAARLQSDAQNEAARDPRHISVFISQAIDDATGESIEAAAIPTGLRDLDAKLNGGVRDGELILIGARPGMGKTSFAFGVARNMSLDQSHKRTVLAFSLEMTGKAQAARLLSAESGIPAQVFRTRGEIINNPQVFGRVHEKIRTFLGPDDDNRTGDGCRLWIDDTPGISLSHIRSRARQFIRQHGERPIIIVDYLQIVNQSQRLEGKTNFVNQTQVIGMISQGLKSLARELNTPVIALSQLNRSLESRTSKQPILSDLRDSGSLEQDADIILFLYRDVVYNPDTPMPEKALAIVAKQRDGEIGPVPLVFDSTLVCFDNERRYDFNSGMAS